MGCIGVTLSLSLSLSLSALTAQSVVVVEVEEESAMLGEVLLTVEASDIDGDSDGNSITYSLEASDNSLVCVQYYIIYSRV